MRPNTHSQLSTALTLPNVQMFSDIIQQIMVNDSLPENRQRDMVSGLRRVAKALGRPPEEVPCDTRWLQKRLEKVSPAALDLAPKSWQNAVSDARAALAFAGIVERKNRKLDDLAPEWRALWSALLAAKDKSLPPPLCRFIHFLNRQGVAPDEVGLEHADAYLEAMIASEISKSPEVTYRAAVNGWNLAVRRVSGWPQTHLPLPSRQVKYVLTLEAFPSSFQASYADLFRSFSEIDPLAEEGRTKPVRPSTLLQYRRQLLRFASELVHSGVPIEELVDIRCVLSPTFAERGLRQMLSRTGNETTRALSEMARFLANLGTVLNLSLDERALLRRLASRLALKPQKGITQKNRKRLLVLQDERQQLRLLNLPEQIFRKASAMKQVFYRGIAQEDAIAIAILLTCPLRIKNVASIHVEQNLQRPGDGRAFLVFDDAETKTERPIQFEVPKDVLRMIDRHLATRGPNICPPGTPWLFPVRDGSAPIVPNYLSQRISTRIRRETGIEMNAHLFRHFAVMMWLDANPGSYEAARHLLGHSTVSHTINMYSGLESTTAIKAFSDLVLSKKGRKR